MGGKGVDVMRGRQCVELATRLYAKKNWGSLNGLSLDRLGLRSLFAAIGEVFEGVCGHAGRRIPCIVHRRACGGNQISVCDGLRRARTRIHSLRTSEIAHATLP